MATSSISLYKAAGSAVTFGLQGTTGMKTSYINSASSLALPDSLVINHEIKAAGAEGSDRHSVLKQLAVKSSTTGRVGFISLNGSLSIARNDSITDATIVEQVCEFLSYFTGDLSAAQVTKVTGVVAALIDGMTP